MNLTVTGPAPRLEGDIRLPGDKSISHRALLLGALAEGPSRIKGLLRAGVTEVMLQTLRQLGTDIEYIHEDDLVILGGPWRQPKAPLDCGRSASTLRMLLGALASKPLEVTLSGSAQLRQRPMGRVVDPLLQMGANIEGWRGGAQPPLRVRGADLHGIEHRMPVASAQVKTALLLAGLSAQGETTVHEPGPARDHTERMLRGMGVPVRSDNGAISVRALEQPLPGFQLQVPGDLSAAAFALVAAAASPGSSVQVEGVGVNPRRAGILEALRAMGSGVRVQDVHLEHGEPVAAVQVDAADLNAIEVGGPWVVRMIDEIPALAVAMTQARGESVVRDAQELRVKESNRIEALVTELRKLGAEIEATEDGLRVRGPSRLKGGRVNSHGDHRLAMSLVVAGLLAHGETTIEGVEVIDESFPGFLDMWRSLGVEL